MYFTISDYTGVPSALVVECAADVNQQTIENVDSLMGAASWGHLAVVNFLLEHDANFFQHLDIDGFNALLWAVNNRRTEVARHFVAIELGTDQRNINGFWMSFNFGSGGSHPQQASECTLIPAAAVPTHYRRASQPNAPPPPQAAATPQPILLWQAKCRQIRLPPSPRITGVAPLSQTQHQQHQPNQHLLFNFLLEHDANFQHVDVEGYNALMWAVIKGRTEMARHLVAIGAGIHHRDMDGKSARQLAEESGNAEMVAIFRATATDIGRHAEGTDGQQNDQQQ
ncbi:hypothetical protein niasHT_002724 [Heterodera trifolii]|uniref:Uncharacterized protein n=1 Tax=Heterodera trifolii TaxID=157864 RepID=A0ABD2MF39_9BILA